jgi:histone acetyltransferase MYST1
MPLQGNNHDDASDHPVSKALDEHPLDIGAFLVVKYRDGSHRLAKIIEKSKRCKDKAEIWSYYVHYPDFNRRMDEWISVERIVLLPSEASIFGDKFKKNILHHHAQIGSLGSSGELKKAFDTIQDAACFPGEGPNRKNVSGNITSARKKAKLASDTTSEAEDGVAEGMPKDSESTTNENDFGDGEDCQPTTVAELEHDEHEGLDEAQLLEHEEITKVKNVANVLFGRYIMETWYFSPFPREYTCDGPVDCLYFCEFSFRFFRTKEELIRFQKKPSLSRHPPGNEIYRDPVNRVSMFEVDGAIEKVYCQNLCFFAKLFLDHKTLYWDVDPFLFYVLCSQDERGYHPVGFFSKEKYVLTHRCMIKCNRLITFCSLRASPLIAHHSSPNPAHLISAGIQTSDIT